MFHGDSKQKILCHVIETSYGIDRPLYCVLEHAYTVEAKRNYIKLKKWLAPIDVGVLPLLKRDGLPEKANRVRRDLRSRGLMADYDESGSIGRRYARADEIGTPYCVTIDHQTLKDATATIRDRDTSKQVRVLIDDLEHTLRSLLSDKAKFEDHGGA